MVYDNDGPIYSVLNGKPDCSIATCPSPTPFNLCATILGKSFWL